MKGLLFIFKLLFVFIILLCTGCVVFNPTWNPKIGSLKYNPMPQESHVDVYIREDAGYREAWDKYETQKSLLERNIPSEVEVIGFINSGGTTISTKTIPTTFKLVREKGGNAIRYLEFHATNSGFGVRWEVLRYTKSR